MQSRLIENTCPDFMDSLLMEETTSNMKYEPSKELSKEMSKLEHQFSEIYFSENNREEAIDTFEKLSSPEDKDSQESTGSTTRENSNLCPNSKTNSSKEKWMDP